MANHREFLLSVAAIAKKLGSKLGGEKNKWRVAAGKELLINPPTKCPGCEQWVQTQRVWVMRSKKGDKFQVLGVWDIKSGERLNTAHSHPHAGSAGHMCHGQATSAAQALALTITQGNGYIDGYRWLYEQLGHDCNSMFHLDCDRCKERVVIYAGGLYGNRHLCKGCFSAVYDNECARCRTPVEKEELTTFFVPEYDENRLEKNENMCPECLEKNTFLCKRCNTTRSWRHLDITVDEQKPSVVVELCGGCWSREYVYCYRCSLPGPKSSMYKGADGWRHHRLLNQPCKRAWRQSMGLDPLEEPVQEVAGPTGEIIDEPYDGTEEGAEFCNCEECRAARVSARQAIPIPTDDDEPIDDSDHNSDDDELVTGDELVDPDEPF